MTVRDDRFVDALRTITGPVGFVDDPELTTRYRWDWTGRFGTDDPVTVARPGTTDEVAAIVRLCVEHEVAVVPQGGNTGLVGGSVPLAGELVVSTERLRGVAAVDATAGLLTARAGTPLAAVQHAAADHGWRYGVDIASRDSATIGGTVATNAGGLHVLRYGATRAQLTGVAFVDGTGARHELGGTNLRDNTGYDLPGLLCGSEGTLGIITDVRVRLVADLGFRTTALLRFAEVDDAAVAVEAIRGALPSIESAEFFFAPGLELVCAAFSYPPPFAETTGGYVLVEVADTEDRTGALATAVDGLSGVSDVAVADDAGGRARLWRYRERHTEAIATVGVPHKLDVAVPPGTLADFVGRVADVVASVDPDARVWLFGHGGEASVHVNVTGPAADDETTDDAVLDLVVAMGGSISAEHGIGTAKRTRLDQLRDRADRDLRNRLRDAFDPHRIMNPGVLTGSG